MKRVALLITLSIFFFSSKAQTMKDITTRINEIEDRIAIKNLVDTFSILADVKDIKTKYCFSQKTQQLHQSLKVSHQ